ncbi:hypothetical protein G6O69_02500 [Pseudenhygromyxa sp. WMMC2535]|uniref:hypothetical protein n=1 Tax=Pseudenhygromyxa sp. WMMC2535 TaxID=2712867 RepID=UPI00155445AB|nr:hypothetical protein [Pseudenhygromyxa sp. WMMC2535]NVB36685.1 hypothetical protein [Pseudenhygromyxa sp. WMMC2535]
MILVSGTKRSGTSMWMQVLRAAGVPVLGEAFPRNWRSSLHEANPDGFYESLLRQGIYYRTNPHPLTGEYFLPEHVEGYAVKVFIPGVIRSERAYITKLVANIRPWREYVSSLRRLYALEDAARRAKLPDSKDPFRFPPAFEWWMENFALVRDLSLRRYPARLQAYDQLVERPEALLPELLTWLGVPTERVADGVAAINPERRTQRDPDLDAADEIEPALARVFDDLYAAVRGGHGLSGALLQTLNQTNQSLLSRLASLQRELASAQVERASKAGGAPRAEPVSGLPAIKWS